ncbi:MAG: penicillin-binding transpeptidase domain-containing protein [Planctomycetota bacterium]
MRPYRLRLRILLGCIGVAFVALGVRLADLQIRKVHFYGGEAVRRRVKTSLVDTRRGSVKDRNGNVLAQDKPSFDVCVLFSSSKDDCADQTLARYNPNTDKYELNPGVWLPSIARLSGMPARDIEEKVRGIIAEVEATREQVIRGYVRRHAKKPPRSFKVPEEVSYQAVLTDVDFDLISWVEVANDHFPGIKVEAKARRFYPYKDSAAHVIGYTAPIGGEEIEKWGESYAGSPYKRFLVHDYIGRTGVEKHFDKYLRGTRGEVIEEINVLGRRQEVLASRPPIPGDDVYLTIDIDLQRAAEAGLGKQNGAMVLMDPRSGEILALATCPRFDLNAFSEDYERLLKDPAHPMLHRAALAAMPPGSVFKIVTATAGLETQKLTPVSTYTCTGSITLGRITFGCWSKGGHGDVCMREAIEQSCNVYFFNAGRKTGGAALRRWGEKYGLGSLTGIDIQEAQGNLMNPKTTGDEFNMAIGQGRMLVTPIQMARLIAVVANGGTLIRPHLLRKIVDCHGKTVNSTPIGAQPVEKATGIHASTIEFLRTALRNVLTEGPAHQLPDTEPLAKLGVAGKTGTAQTSVETENQAWFTGFAPYDNPQICFVVFAEKVPGHGGETCIPLVRPVLEYYFQKRQLAALDE